MKQRCVTYLLLLLIAVQSLAVVADGHRFHQDGLGHRLFEQHDHAMHVHQGHVVEGYAAFDHNQDTQHKITYIPDVDSIVDISFELEANTEPDCHHCCHCHGAKLNYLINEPTLLLVASKQQTVLDFHQSALSALTLPLLRPPIA